MKYNKLLIGFAVSLLSCISISAQAATNGAHEFTFNLTVPKNTCDVKVVGTSNNVVDFGNIPISKFKSDVPEGKLKLPFSVTLSNCKTNNYDGVYLTLSGNYIADNNGYLDESNKTFAVRISNKDNAKQSDTDFITETNNKLIPKITGTPVTETFYAYIMCKTGESQCADDVNVGGFKSTLTLTLIAD